MRLSRESMVQVTMALVLAIGIVASAAVARSGDNISQAVVGFAMQGDRATVTLRAGTYKSIDQAEGQRIEMEGFGYVMVPGMPQLPMGRFLIALPPGARARSVEVVGVETSRLTGTYQIGSCPPMMPLTDPLGFDEAMQTMQRDWQANHDAVYLADEPYPERVAWLSGTGTLRKYSYAAIAFCPFAYYPQSGRLYHHREVEVAVTYDLPSPGSEEARHVQRLMYDRSADLDAAAVFSNYGNVADLYTPCDMQPAPLDETYDYVIITTPGLVGAVTSSGFTAWKTALGHNLRTVLTTDTEITSQAGGDLAEQIRNFLRAYYATWGIEYVLVVGDYATVPMRICYPDPDFHLYDPSDPGLVAPGTPTDYYYADLSFADATSWDSDGDGYHGEYGDDSPDFQAEVAVGRIPVNDSTRITYTLDKLVAFEQDTGAWKSNVLHAGAILFFENQNYSGYPFIDGATCLDSIETGLMGALNITHFSEQSGLVASPFPWPALTEAAFTSAWGTGEYAHVNWSGHGWSDGAYRTVWEWDDGDGVPESGNGEMRSYRFIGSGSPNIDDDHPSIVFAISCNVGYPDPNPYGNLGIDMLTLPGWGPSAGIVSSSRPAAVSGDWKNSPGGTEQICYEFNRYMIAEAEVIGDALYDGKFYATTNYGWDHYYEYMNLYNFNLYGDPALAAGGASARVVHDRDVATGTILRLGPAEPNPFGPAVTLRFALSAPSAVRIAVYDVTGREVALLADEDYPAGEFTITWDGSGTEGRALSSGLYLVKARASGQTVVRKIVSMR
jgi:hypothetical protein